MKMNLSIFLIIVILLSGCTTSQNEEKKQDNNINAETEIANMGNNDIGEMGNSTNNKMNLIELTYFGEISGVNYRMRHIPLDYDPNGFAWWNHYTKDDLEHLSKHYKFVLPDDVDITKHDIIISFGRKLTYLYYYENEYKSDSCYEEENGYRGRPVFENNYTQSSAYVYLIDKINLIDSEIASSDLNAFISGDIPFELPPDD